MTIVIRYAILDPSKPYQFNQIYFLKGIMMTSGKRFIWILTMAAFLVMTSGCASTNLRRIDEEITRNGTGIHKEEGQSIEGYLLQDGTREEYKGRVRLAERDTLIFWGEEGTGEKTSQGEGMEMLGPVFPITAVKALDVKEKRVGMTVLLVAGVIAVVGIVVMAVAYPKKIFEEVGTSVGGK